MPREERKRKELLDDIIETELRMLEQVKTSEPSLCKERPETFRAMRGMTHSVLPTPVLQSYLGDLQKAEAECRNLLAEKYARMDNRIPPLKTSPLVDAIVELESRWVREYARRHPLSFGTASSRFKLYLSCELETYSDRTLELYFGAISKAEKEERNLAEERYTTLFAQMAYNSDEMELKRDVRG
jgi:hypothetical protein